MYQLDKDALLCDLAEVYGIFDFRAVPLKTLSILACGLRSDSRIRMKIDGINELRNLEIMAHIADELALIRFFLTRSKKSDPLPELFTDHLITERSEGSQVVFESGKAFHDEWTKLTKAVAHG